MKKQRIIVVASLFVTAAIFTTGCTINGNNQMRQQGTRMQQAQNQQAQNQQAQNQQAQDQPQGNMDNRIQIANQAAEKIIQLDGVSQANVLVTRRNAYVAAAMDTNQQMTSDIENQIAEQVRATDPNIQNVYVSTNPEFLDRVNSYVTEAGQGRPAAGFVDQFNEMVQRIFPNAR